MTARIVHALHAVSSTSRASLGECPVWSDAEQVLYWVDINAPSLNRFDPATGRNTAMPMPESIGCFALRAARRLRRRAARAASGSPAADGTLERKVADAPYDPTHHRFNDGRCDRAGPLFAGTMNEKRDADTAALVSTRSRFRAARQVLAGMMISNGLAWSPDGRTMYHADTPTRVDPRVRLRRATGTPSSPRAFARLAPAKTDRPDGGAVDSAGSYWTAFYRGGKVVRICRRAANPRRVPGAGDVPDDVRVRRRRPEDALRDERAPERDDRRARASAAIGRHLRDARRRAGACPSPRLP